MTKLEEAAKNLRAFLGDNYETFTIGIAHKSQYNPEDYLVIYLHKKVRTAFPTVFEGFRVEKKYIGKIEIKRSEDGGI